jgi:hypothetical protein
MELNLFFLLSRELFLNSILFEYDVFGAFKGLVEQKNVVFNSFVCKLGFFLALVDL